MNLRIVVCQSKIKLKIVPYLHIVKSIDRSIILLKIWIVILDDLSIKINQSRSFQKISIQEEKSDTAMATASPITLWSSFD